MKNQYAIIGLGRFGMEVARTLSLKKQHIIAIDFDEANVRAIADHVTLAVQLDATDEKALREAGVQNVDTAIVSIGENIEASILVVMLLKDLGIKNIIAKAVSELHGRILSQLGINRMVYPERDMARKLAGSLLTPELQELFELSSEYRIVELPAPDFIWDKTIIDAGLRGKHGITIIALKNRISEDTEDFTWNINPRPTDIIKKGDVLIALGANRDIEKFI